MPQKTIILLFCILFFYSFGSKQQKDSDIAHFNTTNQKLVGDGYDLVSYFSENKPVKGKSSISSRFQGLLFYFSSQENKDLLIEEYPKSCTLAIDDILAQLDEFASDFESKTLRFENCNLETEMEFSGVTTSFKRELVYCLDHCIHHQYFIKIGLVSLELGHYIHEDFGIAPSTLMHRKS